MKGFSRVDHIRAIKQAMGKSAGCNKPHYMAFIDYDKAFDSVTTTAVMEALRNHGIEETYVVLFEDIYEGSTGTFLPHKRMKQVPIKKGVRQFSFIRGLKFFLSERVTDKKTQSHLNYLQPDCESCSENSIGIIRNGYQ